MSECPIEKIKEIIRSSPEYIVCTVKPVTHYTSHEDSPRAVRSAYTEVDPDALQAGNTKSSIYYYIRYNSFYLGVLSHLNTLLTAL